MLKYFLHPLDHALVREEKPNKVTFFQSQRILVGLNTLAPQQGQPLHDHADQDKLYYVLDGQGLFTVGNEVRTCQAGDLILAPAAVEHGVSNDGDQPLTFLTVIAPSP